MNHVKIIQTTPSELSALISESVKKEIESLKKELEKNNDTLLTRKETCQFLDVNPATLWRYEKKGKLLSKKIGNRVYYLKSDVLQALNS